MSAYPIEPQTLDVEIYQIIAAIAATKTLHRWAKKHRGLKWVAKMAERSELSRRLISLAVIIRNSDEGRLPDSKAPTVGLLIPNENNKEIVKPLHLREACNKIIHAKEVDFYPGLKKINETTPLSQVIELWGEKNQIHWIAKLDLLAFAEAACGKV